MIGTPATPASSISAYTRTTLYSYPYKLEVVQLLCNCR